jgi:hypothetical protein
METVEISETLEASSKCDIINQKAIKIKTKPCAGAKEAVATHKCFHTPAIPA